MLISKILIKSLEQCQLVPDEELVRVELVGMGRIQCGLRAPWGCGVLKAEPRAAATQSQHQFSLGFFSGTLFTCLLCFYIYLPQFKMRNLSIVHNICVSLPCWCSLRVVKACKSQQCVVHLSAAQTCCLPWGAPRGEGALALCSSPKGPA